MIYVLIYKNYISLHGMRVYPSKVIEPIRPPLYISFKLELRSFGMTRVC